MENMRFKFRAWHEYGSDDMKSPGMIYDEKPGDCLTWKNQGQKIVAIMQYTGLKDRNGREVYEGDIVKDADTGNIRQVLYNAPSFVLMDKNRYFYWTYHADEYEVLGNIYEHPHLLDPA